MTITQRIFDIMDRKGISQAELSQKTDISTSAISAWKKRGTFPSSEKIPKIAECLNVSINELYGFEADSYTSNTISNTGTNNGTQANIINNDCSIDTFNNPAVLKAYKGLTEREKLSVQMFILDTAAASEKSNAKVEVIERKE